MMQNDKPFPIVPNTIKNGLITKLRSLANSLSAEDVSDTCVSLAEEAVKFSVINGYNMLAITSDVVVIIKNLLKALLIWSLR